MLGLQQSATRGSAINVLQVVFSYAWDILILHNDANSLRLLGAAMVIMGVLSVTEIGVPMEEAEKEQIHEESNRQTEK